MACKPTADEVADIKLAAQKLWDLDENRLTIGEDYELNVQGGKKSYQLEDTAREKLFKRVSKDVWKRPTFLIFYHLLDNYSAEQGVEETTTVEERKEINDFLDAILRTKPMQYCHAWLVANDLAEADLRAFKNQLYQMWFAFYRREGQNDSCGFEHVFVGETDDGEVSGFHNWINFWIEESKGKVDYRGYMLPRSRREVVDETDRLLTLQFAWEGKPKQVTTLFIGTSPEFEFALYTMAFLARNGAERVFLEINEYDLNVRCYAIRSKYGDKIATVFPEVIGEDPTNAMAQLSV